MAAKVCASDARKVMATSPHQLQRASLAVVTAVASRGFQQLDFETALTALRVEWRWGHKDTTSSSTSSCYNTIILQG